MKIVTKKNGIVNYEQDDVIEFKKGLPGFENLTKFILVSVQENEMFSVLQSVEDLDVGIVVTSPLNILEDYKIELEEKVRKDLNIKDDNEVYIYNTITLDSDIKKITSNLRAPIIVNVKDKLGEQVLLNDDKYEIKYPLFKE